jgi:Aspartyl protease
LHVFAYVGSENNTDNKLPEFPYENEARSLMVSAGDEDSDWRKSFHLQPGERRGWWSGPLRGMVKADIALVNGAVCNHRTRILLDSGSSTSILSLALAKKLGLSLCFKHKLTVRGLGDVLSHITAKTKVKITLGMSVVYYMEIWCGNIGEGAECLLGMDFMMAAGVCLSANDGTV